MWCLKCVGLPSSDPEILAQAPKAMCYQDVLAENWNLPLQAQVPSFSRGTKKPKETMSNPVISQTNLILMYHLCLLPCWDRGSERGGALPILCTQ